MGRGHSGSGCGVLTARNNGRVVRPLSDKVYEVGELRRAFVLS